MLPIPDIGEKNMAMATQDKITNLQQELLNIFSFDVSEEDLREIKTMLSNYFSEKRPNDPDRLWEARGWTDKAQEFWDGE